MDISPLANIIARRRVVADGEVGLNTRACVRQSVGAVLRSAADLGGTSPNDLAEVAPAREVAGVNIVAAVGSWIVGHLVVVHVVRDHKGNLVGREASPDVLAIAAASSSPAVRC